MQPMQLSQYSPDQGLCDFFFFSIGKFISRVRFEDVEDIRIIQQLSFKQYEKGVSVML